jgi:hypothetical protein
MALLQPSGVSLDKKKEKKLSHCNQPKKNNQSTPESTAETKNKSITARPKNCRRKPHQTRISERNRS